MKGIFVVAGLLLGPALSFSQDRLAPEQIPAALRENASMVVQWQEIKYEIDGLEKASYQVHKIFTVLSAEGKHHLLFNKFQSRNYSLESAEIKVFDAGGKQTGRYKKKDMRTESVGDGLIEDGYVTYFSVPVKNYPVTIELKYEQKLKSTLGVPSFFMGGPEESVIASRYVAKIPKEIGFRYRTVLNNVVPTISENGKEHLYTWQVSNLPARKYEEGAAAGANRYPHVEFATNKFSYYNREGDLSSWKTFGDWMNKLYIDQDRLSQEKQEFFRNLVKDVTDEKEKIKKIYQYLQANFRYVSIQLGIGGYKPFSAAFTDSKKYGDCKALSNYMKAALNVIGIPSYIAVINASYNEEPVDPEFPTNNFNHVILCVPTSTDTTWLECTSSTSAFGELGTFTENRNALLLTDAGGVLVQTPESKSASNRLSTYTRVRIDEDFSAVVEIDIQSSGEFRRKFASMLKEKADVQKNLLVYSMGMKRPDAFDLTAIDSMIRLRMFIAKLSEFSAGENVFFSQRLFALHSGKLPQSENRTLDYYFRFPFEKTDTTVFKLPSSFAPGALSPTKLLETKYAKFESSYWYNQETHSIYAATRLVLNKHRIPASEFAALRTFFDQLNIDDAQRLVIKKSEAPKKAF